MNEAIDDDNQWFFGQDGDVTIHDCFKGVLQQNVDNTLLIPRRFRRIVENILGAAFRWPDTYRLGNAFKYLWEQYATNTQNNLNTHCESRLKKFFKVRAYELNEMIRRDNLEMPWFTGSDVTNAVKFAYHRKNHARDNPMAEQKMQILLQQLYDVDAPNWPQDPFNIRWYTKRYWFHSMRMWVLMQREIAQFHERYAELNRQWSEHKVRIYLSQHSFVMKQIDCHETMPFIYANVFDCFFFFQEITTNCAKARSTTAAEN